VEGGHPKGVHALQEEYDFVTIVSPIVRLILGSTPDNQVAVFIVLLAVLIGFAIRAKLICKREKKRFY
jgi:hypothetical protein